MRESGRRQPPVTIDWLSKSWWSVRKRMEQARPIFQSLPADCGRTSHIVKHLAGIPATDPEGLVLHAGIVRPFPIGLIFQAHVGGNGSMASPKAAHDRAERGTPRFARNRGPRRFLPAVAAVELVGRVQMDEMHSAKDGELVRDFGLHRHQLADFHAGDIRADRAEFAAVLAGSLRLHVVHIEMRRSAAQENHDDGFLPPIAERRSGPQTKHVSQR